MKQERDEGDSGNKRVHFLVVSVFWRSQRVHAEWVEADTPFCAEACAGKYLNRNTSTQTRLREKATFLCVWVHAALEQTGILLMLLYQRLIFQSEMQDGMFWGVLSANIKLWDWHKNVKLRAETVFLLSVLFNCSLSTLACNLTTASLMSNQDSATWRLCADSSWGRRSPEPLKKKRVTWMTTAAPKWG